MVLAPGRKLYEDNRDLMREWTGDSGLPWSDLSQDERIAWEELAAERESTDREEAA